MREYGKDPARISGARSRSGRAARATLRHPFGPTLLIASLLMAVEMRFLPGLERWSAQAPLVLFWGLFGSGASLIAIHRWRQEPSAPELRELQSVRRLMQAKLADRKAANGSGPSELVRILSEAIRYVDKQIAPALEQLLVRQGEVSNLLSRYEGGELPLPGPEVLERLRSIRARQRAAIDECVQQASNAAGTLVALLQEGDDASVAHEARKWATDLLNLYDAIGEVLRGEAEQSDIKGLDARPPVQPSASADRNGRASSEVKGNGQSLEGFPRLVEEALRQLNNPSVLSQCELVSQLPVTLFPRSSPVDTAQARLTPLEQAQVLRDLLVSAIERLRPPNETPRAGDAGALQYHILHEEYVMKRPTRHIMMRLSISPNPPKDTDGRREESGRGVRELQGK